MFEMLFADEQLGTLKKRAIIREPPATPETGWRPPQSFPNLSAAKVIGFDLERKENDFDHGPGWSRGKAETVGFSIAAKDLAGNSAKWYFPIRHAVEPQYNLDPETCLSWLKYNLETTPHIPKVGANLIYDVGSLTDDGIFVTGELHDCQFAEALLHSDGLVNLDYLGEKYLGEGKQSNLLYEWCAQAYGGKATGVQRDNIWRASPRLAGPYGETDALHPIEILEKQLPQLWREGLIDLYRLECGLIPLLVRMRRIGVSVDLNLAQQIYDELGTEIGVLYRKLFDLVPIAIDSVYSSRDLAKIFDAANVKYPVTEDGNPSFRKDWLHNHDHPVTDVINDIREHIKIRDTFIKAYILEGNINGRIHGQLHPLRGDTNGTVVGRFSSSDPNLQNIPVRSKLGKRVRTVFVPDAGHLCWEKNDFSQLQYRGLAHYAVGPGSDELRERYRTDPNTDYHKQVQANVKDIANVEIERRPIKNMNFGLIFGMGEPKLNRTNGFSPEQGKAIFKAYHTGNPYIKATMQAAMDEIQILGFITSVLGRKSRFNLWEPVEYDRSEERPTALPYDFAMRRYGRVKRAYAHKALSHRLQGTEADQIKTGMLRTYEAGIFDVIGVPRLQVHDELDFSVIDESPIAQEAYREMRHILSTCLPQMKVPIKVDFNRGENWGKVE